METIDDLLSRHPFFKGLKPEYLALIAGCGQNVHFDAGAYLLREGETADRFFAIRGGSVAVETVRSLARRRSRSRRWARVRSWAGRGCSRPTCASSMPVRGRAFAPRRSTAPACGPSATPIRLSATSS